MNEIDKIQIQLKIECIQKLIPTMQSYVRTNNRKNLNKSVPRKQFIVGLQAELQCLHDFFSRQEVTPFDVPTGPVRGRGAKAFGENMNRLANKIRNEQSDKESTAIRRIDSLMKRNKKNWKKYALQLRGIVNRIQELKKPLDIASLEEYSNRRSGKGEQGVKLFGVGSGYSRQDKIDAANKFIELLNNGSASISKKEIGALTDRGLGAEVNNILGEAKFKEFKRNVDKLTTDNDQAHFKYEHGRLEQAYNLRPTP